MTTAERLILGAGDRVRLRASDRAKGYLFGSGLIEYGDVTVSTVSVALTLRGRAFVVEAEGDERLVLRDDEGEELLAYSRGRKASGRIGDLTLDLPQRKKPGALKDGRDTLADVVIQNGVIRLDLRAPVAPLVALLTCTVVLLRVVHVDQRTKDGMKWTTMPSDHSFGGKYAAAAIAGGVLLGGAWGAGDASGSDGGGGCGGGGCGGGP
jgi:hypothetical protein